MNEGSLHRLIAWFWVLVAVTCLVACGARERRPIDYLPVLDHTKPGPPEHPPPAEAAPVKAVPTGRAPASYATESPAHAGSSDGRLELQRQADQIVREHRIRQRDEDAVAMVREDWRVPLSAIERLHVAASCSVVTTDEANMGTIKLLMVMYHKLTRAGIEPRTGLDPQVLANQAAKAGAKMATERPALCSQMRPADRARVRQALQELIAGP